VGFHESLGFEPAGVWRQCGWKLGRWWDVGVWQKELQAAANPPPATIPFAALAERPAWTALLEQAGLA
jgi:phosphinothricin acetyltransferase